MVVLLCTGAEGKRKKGKDKNKPSEPSGEGKKEGEKCQFHGFPWGTCAKAISCPGATKLSCEEGLRCCRDWTHNSHDEDTISEKEYPAYLKLHDSLNH
ncbi:hypothetical protein ACROYT_G012977 [Oculina patagonica]